MSNQPHNPPKWINWILEFYCKSEVLEDLQGDLYEYYNRNLSKGPFRANLIFLIDVIKFCRLYTVRKPKILNRMTFFSLFKNYFKTSIRSLRRHKLFSIINITGLAISMSVGLLAITYLSELFSYDEFHEKKDRTYRIISDYKGITSDNTTHLASTSIFIGNKLAQDYAGYEDLVLMRRSNEKDLIKGENIVSAKWLYATESFFDVFSFNLTSGNPQTALLEPYSIVITDEIAKKLFKDKNPLDQIIEVEGNSYTVTGVVTNVPSNSHIQFDVLASMKTKEQEEAKEEDSRFLTWRSVWMNHVYLTLSVDQSPDLVQRHLDEISSIENVKNERYTINFKLQPLTEIVPGIILSNQIGPTEDNKTIYQLLTLTLIVLLSACFNYTNLSIARSLRRSKEVGIRKVVGATRTQVLIQFISESVVVAFIALIFGYGLFELIKKEFLQVVVRGIDLSLTIQWHYVLYFLTFALVIGLVAGLLPALFLSNLKAITIFGDASRLKFFKGISLRRVLIILQFSLSMAFVMGATIAYRQYNFALNFDLGFQTENILNVELKGNDPDLLYTQFKQLSEVQNLSLSGIIPGAGSTYSNRVKYKNLLDSVLIYTNHVDSAYLRLHGFKLLAGYTFPYNLKEGESAKYIIIDEKLRKKFGFENPQAAIGEVLSMSGKKGKKLEISGVIENFQYTTIQSESEPTVFFQGHASDYQFVNLKINTNDLIGLMDKLEKAWVEVDNIHPFEAYFFEESIQDVYYEYKIMFKVFAFLAFLAIVIAAMGLLGMAVFTTETRMKEISVRKVLGASQKQLIFLLSGSFLIMLLIAAFVAIPATYLLFENYVLDDYVNRVSIGLVEILPGILLIFVIGWLAISWQTIKASKTNPAEMLKKE
ncbi:MAG: putative ABC transport system permease protein [Cyclobacteriaceae bacterium]|jgi:putative ABC transport system permease protein